jgi:adenine-specific DNA-methyltransferase
MYWIGRKTSPASLRLVGEGSLSAVGVIRGPYCRPGSPCEPAIPDVKALEHIANLSYGACSGENRLIYGDNLTVLDRIGGNPRGAVRCVYIDPPYNNRERYAHYDDRHSHEQWLATMEANLEALAPLLTSDGSIWISIDDNEVHYLKVLADRVLGRERFVTTIVWEHRTSRENRRVFSNNHEYLLVYAQDPDCFKASRNPIALTDEILARYKNPDDDPRGPWQSVSLTAQAGHGTRAQYYTVVAPNGTEHDPPKGRCWIYNEDRMLRAIADDTVWFGADGGGVPRLKRFLSSAPVGMTPPTLWSAEIAGTSAKAKREVLKLFPGEQVFETPKPEQLLAQVLGIATDPGDLVLDSYLGSGTTAAVAHKMGRRWIGIESGEHAVSHCRNRLSQVIDGESGGVSKQFDWSGGGGFRFERCLPALRQAA